MDLRPFRASRFAEGAPLVGEYEDGDRNDDHARIRNIAVGYGPLRVVQVGIRRT